MSILSALHEGEFTMDEVQAELQMLFEKQYILTEAVVRGNALSHGNRHGRTARANDYEPGSTVHYYICTVKLENFDLSHVPVYIMDEETLSLYAVSIWQRWETGPICSRLRLCGQVHPNPQHL